ncbi:nucleoside-diphosphate-sugar epimerase [Tenacibaculum sp. E3R01]|uniref:NAD-dependent epimerase/dehydratase family protein n=1 Tax=Tenacibaculum sp. E3R01 TaxID=2267227 RepID=UPI000DEA8A21|nr:NAD-dependent epimerase/dehydratase family protein [Tenacibaculum sp. E3R01]RBW54267.1 nucleoside-diphosphate-sugar epimerase [Tenacibaculum sp. E3R01]
MSNILISGITGFVGSNLKKYLEGEYNVIGISRGSNSKEGILSYKELFDYDFSSIKAFVHLAGKAHDLKKVSNDQEYFKVNFELTKDIFDFFLESTCEVFIYMSSVKAVADEIEGELTEGYKSNPITAYGKSKLAAEEYILTKKIPDNKRVYILRPCMIHGPNNKGNLNLLYNFVSKGIPYPFGVYENKRSFLSVENLCSVIKELIEKPVESGIYNVADDVPLSTKELVKIIGDTINKKVKIWSMPKVIINLIAKIGDLLPLPINTERVQKLTENYVVSNEKIKQQIKKELPLSVKEGIKITIKSFNK